MLFSLFYEIALHCYAIWAILVALIKKKGWRSIKSRLGQQAPQREKGKQLAWVHAVSFGEMKASARLVARLHDKGMTVVLSTASQTGYNEATRLAKEGIFPIFLPFDFSYLICPLVQQLKPDLLLIIESDFWYHFQRAVKKVGGKIILVNGKLSARSFKRYCQFRFVAKKIFSPLTHFCVQTTQYAERFHCLGIPKSKITVSGNIKLDSVMSTMTEEEKAEAKKEFFIHSEDFVLTLGSTHDPEEKIWLQALLSLWKKYPRIKVFLVARHPERTQEIMRLVESYGISYGRTSQLENFKEVRLLLVDQMGRLLHCYQLSHLAFVGGSFTPRIGGHNLIEPANYGVCALYGPYLHSQPGFAELMKEYEAGMMLQPEEIESVVGELIENPVKLRAYGDRGKQLVEESKGALEKTWNKIEEILPIKSEL